MNQESLAELVVAAQAGDDNALEQLLLWAYTPVSFLCKKLLKDDEIAQTQTVEILQIMAHKLHSLQMPDMFEKWTQRLTAARCIQIQQKNRWMEEDHTDEDLSIDGEELDEMQTVDAVQKMVDMLPEKPRICMTLLCCCDMHSADIAKLTGYSVEEVKESMGQAQNFVLEQLQKCQEKGIQLYPITSLTDVLQSGMRHEQETAAIKVVYGILGKEIPIPPDPDRKKKTLLTVLIVVLVVINLALAGVSILLKNKHTFSPDDYSAVVVPVPTAETHPEITEETVPETEAPAETETTGQT